MSEESTALPGGSRPEIPDHQLLGRIGGGSYGDVWLARNATGSYRAVKILHRARFGGDGHPFEREFDGLSRFEPVSRGHEHVVDILHIGRHGDLLYYVMELADDAGGREADAPEPDPARYVPDTLSERVERSGRLPITACLEVAGALSEALAHLHAHGLVHRDVKPSNVLFVDGVLKLADVGLVSTRDATVSLVGTEGFIPPEGPGTVQADLYAMGKILYELSSGLDRMEFPAVPEWVMTEAGEEGWSELNEVILKCCERDSGRRYASAMEVLEDLALLERGGSLVKRQRTRRLWHRAKASAGMLGAAAALVALGVFLGPGREVAHSDSGAVRAAPKGTMLNVTGIEVGLNVHLWREYDLSPDGQALAIEDRETVHVWNRGRGVHHPVLPENPDGWHLYNPRWVNGDRQLVCLGRRPGQRDDAPGESAVLVLDVAQGAIERVVYRTPHKLTRMSLSAATGTVAVRASGQGGDPEGLLAIDLTDGTGEVLQEDIRSVWDFSPDGRWLALDPWPADQQTRSTRAVWLLSIDDGRLVRVTERGGFAGHATWEDERTIVYVAGDSITEESTWNLWEQEIDPVSGLPTGPPGRITTYRNAQVRFPQVVAETGEILFALANQKIVNWAAAPGDLAGARQLVTGLHPLLSRDGKWVYYEEGAEKGRGIHRIATSAPYEQARLTETAPIDFDVSPAGDRLVYLKSVGGTVAVVERNLETGEVAVLRNISAQSGASVRYSPDGSLLAYTAGPDLVVMNADGSAARTLGTIEDWDEEAWEGKLAWSPDGSKLAALGFMDAERARRELQDVFVAEVASGTMRTVSAFATDNEYKEGLNWLADSARLSYTSYGPKQNDSQIRLAYADGQPTTLLINHDADRRWDWVGTWHPNGNEFWFLSYGREPDPLATHLYRLDTGEITPASALFQNMVLLPQWSADQSLMIWGVSSTSKSLWLLRPE